MKKITLFLLSSLTAFTCAFAHAEETTATQPAEIIFVTDDFKLIPKSEHEENQDMHYTIDVNYPQLTGGALTPAAQEFNAIVANLIKTEAARFKRYVTADIPHMQNLPDELKHNSLKIDYDVDVIKPGKQPLISVRIAVEGMQAGRAHPYHTNQVINYDLVNGKLLQLSDLFKPKTRGVNYINVISTYCKKKLEAKLTDKWMINDGTKPVESNFKNWNLESDGIVITFNEYQVAPYVYGAQEVRIPYQELKNMIAADAPIQACVENAKACGEQVVEGS